MDEGRKRTIFIGACILISRKCGQLGPRSSPALEAAIADAIVMSRSDSLQNSSEEPFGE
jgi:hypothetical protein